MLFLCIGRKKGQGDGEVRRNGSKKNSFSLKCFVPQQMLRLLTKPFEFFKSECKTIKRYFSLQSHFFHHHVL